MEVKTKREKSTEWLLEAVLKILLRFKSWILLLRQKFTSPLMQIIFSHLHPSPGFESRSLRAVK